MPALQRTGKEIAEIYNRQVDTVYRICYSFMKNIPDTEDLVQETFLRLLSSGMIFQSESHEKAWLIVTASNLCKDTLKKWWRKTEDISDPSLSLQQPPFEINSVLEAVLGLPKDQKTAVYMYYYDRLRRYGKLYLSHIIYAMLLDKKAFRPMIVEEYKDWGTSNDYRRYE